MLSIHNLFGKITLTKTDWIILVLFLFFAARGFQKGFFKSLLGPFSLILASIISFIYYLWTRDFILSLLINIIGPFVIHFLFSLFFSFAKKKDEKITFISLISRILGAGINLLWQGSIILLLILLLTLLPTSSPTFEKIQEEIFASKTYALVDSIVGRRLPIRSKDDLKNLTNSFLNAEILEKIQSMPEFQEILSNERVQKLLSNAEVNKDVQDGQLNQLLSNPNVKAILEDKELTEKFLSIGQKLFENNQR